MRFVKSICGLAAVMYMAACSDNEIPSITEPGTEEKPEIVMNLKASFEGGEAKDSRAYVSDKGGFFWELGDTMTVTSSTYIAWGYALKFGITKESAGTKEGDFKFELKEGGMDEYQLGAFASSKYFVAMYPPKGGHNLKSRSVLSERNFPTPSDSTLKDNKMMPQVQYQVGKSTAHLKHTLFMVSGEVKSQELEGNGNVYNLPKFTMKHLTSLLYWNVVNRQNKAIQVKEVRMYAVKNGEPYSFFIPGKTIEARKMTSEDYKEGGYPDFQYLAVDVRNDGKTYWELPKGGQLTAYRSVFPVDLSSISLRFEVLLNDGTSVRSLELPGTAIQQHGFEKGKFYRFNLIVDDKLTVQDWETGWMDELVMGGNSLDLNTDDLAIPKEGGSASLEISTSCLDGWKILNSLDWVSVSSLSGPKGKSLVMFTAGPTSEERSGEIVLVTGNLQKTLTVRQGTVVGTDAVVVGKIDSSKVKFILEDNESPDIYFNHDMRAFNTMQPLQYWWNGNDKLHLRFYSPRKLTGVQVWAQMPTLEGMSEEFLLMELEEILPFVDMDIDLPEFTTKDCKFRTKSGKIMTLKRNQNFLVKNLSLRFDSSCDYWRILQKIDISWHIGFSYYDTKTDWNYGYFFSKECRLKPAHCREMVAMALNLTYFLGTDYYRDKLFAEQGKLYDDLDGKYPVDLRRLFYNTMKARRTMWVGLTMYGGVAGGSLWTFPQSSYERQYPDSDYSVNMYVYWHELGHIFGFGHDGNMTHDKLGYGWALLSNTWLHEYGRTKDLPVYSRRFMHNMDRKGAFYGDFTNPVTEWHSFGTTQQDDPELYEIDKGVLWYTQPDNPEK